MIRRSDDVNAREGVPPAQMQPGSGFPLYSSHGLPCCGVPLQSVTRNAVQVTLSDGSSSGMLKRELTQCGYVHLKGMDNDDFNRLVLTLGDVLLRTSVRVRPESRALVMSDKALDLHTDHQRARFIAWQCIRQTDDGGTSLLLDLGVLFDQLPKMEQHHLSGIRFSAHKVFDGDPSEYQLLTEDSDHHCFYYAPFLVLPEHREDPILLKFRQIIREAVPIAINLSEGDVLVVDNHRMLHGRTAIFGSRDRQLERCWIE